jgi:hypothetical protein
MNAAHRIRLLEERVRRAVWRREQDDAPRPDGRKASGVKEPESSVSRRLCVRQLPLLLLLPFRPSG